MSQYASIERFRLTHRAIEAALGSAIRHAQGYSTGEVRDDRTRFHAFIELLVGQLESHREAEKELHGFLRGVGPKVPLDRLDRSESKVEAATAVVARGLEGSRERPSDSTSGARLEKGLRELEEVLREHAEVFDTTLTDEALAEHMSAEADAGFALELAEQAKARGEDEPARLAFLIYNLKAEERRALTSTMPWHVPNLMVPFLWRERWRRMESFFVHSRVA